MASATERGSSNFNLGGLFKASELRSRILFTLLALIVYRLGSYIPLPGINAGALSGLFKSHSGGILGMFDLFAGGALKRMTLFALNIMPYISASIIMQLLTAIIPSLETLKKEGEAGRKKITQYTRIGTVLLAMFQAYGIAVGLEAQTGPAGAAVVLHGGWFFRATTVVTLVGGTIFLMWLGEQITQRGVGNGISLIIFAGIAARIPVAIKNLFDASYKGNLAPWVLILFLLLVVGVIAFVVFIERAQRRILIQYPKQMRGNRMYGGDSSHLPLKINTSGVIPPIFASSLLILPLSIASFSGSAQQGGWVASIATYLAPGQPLYIGIYAALIVFFAFFYTSVVFNPQDTADNLKKSGAFIPGIKPGKNTAKYLEYVLTRLTAIGALYLLFVCLLPELLRSSWDIPLYFGGTSLLIVVSVTMDTITQIQSHLWAQQYEKLLKKSRFGGRRR